MSEDPATTLGARWRHRQSNGAWATYEVLGLTDDGLVHLQLVDFSVERDLRVTRGTLRLNRSCELPRQSDTTVGCTVCSRRQAVAAVTKGAVAPGRRL